MKKYISLLKCLLADSGIAQTHFTGIHSEKLLEFKNHTI